MRINISVYVVFLLVCAVGKSHAQNPIVQGNNYFNNKDYKNALASYFVALKSDKTNPELHFKIGLSYLYSETKEQAITFIEKAYKMNPEIDPKILYYLGLAYQSSYQYAKAKYVYEHYKKRITKKEQIEIDERIQECIFSHAIYGNPINVIIENFGETINSPFDDHSPVVSPDGQTLIFTSSRLDEKTKTMYEDIYISKKENDEWTPPVKMGNKINRTFHDASCSMSPDGKMLFLYYEDHGGNIFVSKLNEKNEWAEPMPLNPNINTAMFRETYASVTADGKKLYFASNRPGGKGGLDIYVSELDPKGQWGKAVNIGYPINTSGDEDSPFIHTDGTLYFSTDGHPTMGRSDIYKSAFKNGAWQKPENLGYPINSIEYDGFFSMSADGTTGYYASRRKYGLGEYDVLRVTYPDVEVKEEPKPAPPPEPTPATPTPAAPVAAVKKEEKPKPVATAPAPVAAAPAVAAIFSGKATDKVSSSPLGVSLSVLDQKTNKVIATIEANKTTGEYQINIKQSGNYVLTAERDGYLFNSINISIPAGSASKLIKNDFVMEKPSAGSILVLRNIYFDSGKADLKSGSISELEKVKHLLNTNPNLKIQINGHTDNVGDPAVNKSLSLKRALAVVNYLALNGVNFDQLSAKGYGSEKPVASNDDEYNGRRLNRRTEIEFVNTDLSVN